VLACSGILSRNYLLLTGRSRKRSPSLASITPFSSSLPSFLGASLLSLSLSPPLVLYLFLSPPCSHRTCILHSPAQLLFMHSAASLLAAYFREHRHKKKVQAERQRIDKLKRKRKKYSRFIIL